MSPEARAAIQALSRCTFQPGSHPKRFVNAMAVKSADAKLTPRQEQYLKLLLWHYRKQILARDPDADLSWALDQPDVIAAFWRKRKKTRGK